MHLEKQLFDPHLQVFVTAPPPDTHIPGYTTGVSLYIPVHFLSISMITCKFHCKELLPSLLATIYACFSSGFPISLFPNWGNRYILQNGYLSLFGVCFLKKRWGFFFYCTWFDLIWFDCLVCVCFVCLRERETGRDINVRAQHQLSAFCKTPTRDWKSKGKPLGHWTTPNQLSYLNERPSSLFNMYMELNIVVPPLPMGDTFQDPQWTPDISDNTEPYT